MKAVVATAEKNITPSASIIEVLGPGCARCLETHRIVTEVVQAAGLDCQVEKVMDIELAGFTVTRRLRVTDCGFEKGKSPATDENIAVVVGKAQAAC